MMCIKKKKSLEEFLLQLEAKTSGGNEEQESESLLPPENRTANNSLYVTNNNAHPDRVQSEAVTDKNQLGSRNNEEFTWDNRKKLFAGLLALALLLFLAFFLVGTMASLKWLNRNDEPDPLPIALGGMAMKEFCLHI